MKHFKKLLLILALVLAGIFFYTMQTQESTVDQNTIENSALDIVVDEAEIEEAALEDEELEAIVEELEGLDF